MHFSISHGLLLAACLATASSNPHARAPKHSKRSIPPRRTDRAPRVKRTSSFLNANTAKFAVNGSALPEVDFNLGESYAGTLPITSNASDPNQLWFWFFPSENPAASNEITIWLNGGPGCSSLDGFLQENGPIQWQSGTFAPVMNKYSWVNLTNMVWIDQPVGTGFSPGVPVVNTEIDVATQFMGFWQNFMETFSMQGFNIYITGESYAGQYIPYIASGMLDANDTEFFNVKGIQINDPSINSENTIIEAAVVPALKHFNNVLNVNDTFMAEISARADSCGYTDFFNTYVDTFPPAGPIPAAPSARTRGCSLYNEIIEALTFVNPCFNIYHLTDFCPFLNDEMGFPSLGGGPNNYFNRSDVQAVIHAPPTDYSVCGDFALFPHGDLSVPSGLGPLPSVIERTNNTLIGHGLLDFLLFANGTLITIQNMTWNGAQGFQTAPSATENFFVPYHPDIGQDASGRAQIPFTDDAGSGFQGTTHTERGLTFVTVTLAGHEIPQYVPGAGFRQLEFLLGRIDSLTQMGDFTTQTGNFTGAVPV